jgi:hypothetical protein
LLQAPANEYVIPFTLSKEQLPVVQPFTETERLAVGSAKPLIMLIFTVGSASHRETSVLIYGSLAVVFPIGIEAFAPTAIRLQGTANIACCVKTLIASDKIRTSAPGYAILLEID